MRGGKRDKHYGLFAKVRPGYTTFYSLGTPGQKLFEQDRTRLTVDVGGVFEYYPYRNVAIRVDAGDTMVHFKTGDFFIQGIDTRAFVQRKLSHNLQINLGFTFRF